LGDEDISGLQITVNDALLVSGGETMADLPSDLDRLLNSQTPAQVRLQRLPLEQLRDDVGRTLVGADVKYPKDVGWFRAPAFRASSSKRRRPSASWAK
jgi:hypothetical protein